MLMMASGRGSRDIQHLEQHEADAAKHGMDHEENGSGEHEQEVHGLGDAGENRRDDKRDNNGFGLIAVTLVRGHDERSADSQVGPKVVEGVAVEVVLGEKGWPTMAISATRIG